MCIIGYLQIQFLSSAIGFRIQQHAQFQYDDFYQLMLEPCVLHCKKETSTLHIMWMQFNEESSSMNHICPLIPQEAISESCKQLIANHNLMLPIYLLQQTSI